MRRASPEHNPAQAAFEFEDVCLPAREGQSMQKAAFVSSPAPPSEHLPVYTVFLRRNDVLSVRERPVIRQPQDASALVAEYLKETDREHFVVLLLDTKNAVIGINTVSVGTLDSALVHPREVYKAAILANAAAIILAHNHPSGDPTPSAEDIRTTERLHAAGKLLDIDVLDHVVVGEKGRYVSLKEHGLL